MTRLDATARTTGRGALRNWRQRISAQDRWRTGGRAPSATAQNRQRAARRHRLGRVGREQLDATDEAVELLLRGEEADADAQRVQQRHGPGNREDPRGQLIERRLWRPARDPE